uniref:Uncharacterized protein n=1 Tax=Pithovirus LCPAC201 TaxID=2506591 RepID=A0A481Z699_9VIRU|nr:MAG: hypothetical protein LCPAC201_02230 [Pithovirus LCPAC201]
MDQPENLIASSDLVKVLVQLDDQSFNLLVDYLKNRKELSNNSGELGRFLRLRRIDPDSVSKGLVVLIDSSPMVKKNFIQALFANKSDSIQPELFLVRDNHLKVKDKTILPILEGLNSPYFQSQETKNNYCKEESPTPFNDRPILKSPPSDSINHVRNPIPYFQDQLIQSSRPNFLPLNQLIQKFSVLSSEEIGDIWLQLTLSELLLPQFYQELLNLLIKDKDEAIRAFSVLIDLDERSLQKTAELLWNHGINIYSLEEQPKQEKVSKLEKAPNNLEPLNYSTSPFPLEFLDSSNRSTESKTTNVICHNKLPDNLGRLNVVKKTDSSLLQSWIILKKNLTPQDREMIGNWIGLSEDQILYLKENVSSVSYFLSNRLHIVRAIDALKIKYGRPKWLVDLAKIMKIRLGCPKVSTEFNSVRAPYQLAPIKIDF